MPSPRGHESQTLHKIGNPHGVTLSKRHEKCDQETTCISSAVHLHLLPSPSLNTPPCEVPMPFLIRPSHDSRCVAPSHTTLDHSRAKEPCETSPVLDGGHTRTESTAPESGSQTLAPSGSVPRRRRRHQTKNSVSQGLSGLLDRLPKPCVKVRRFRQ